MLIRRRKRSGYLIAEVGPCLWLIFIIFSFPLILLESLGMRYSMLLNAVQTAATAGSVCKSFQTDTSSTDLSATNMAKQVLTQAVKTCSGFNVSQVTTYIVICPMGGSSITSQSTPLSSPANTVTNAYNCKVVVQANMSPLLTDPIGIFGNVPGLTGPMPITVQANTLFESTQGLTQ